MPYMLAPGARLMVGPGGQLDESLGACCCGSLGDLRTQASATPKAAAYHAARAAVALPYAGNVQASYSPAISGGGSKTVLLLAAAAGVGLLVYMKRRGKRR